MHLALGSAIRSGANSDTNRGDFRDFDYLCRGGDAVFLSSMEEWINVILGARLVICPLALGISSSAAGANLVVVGLLVVALAFYELLEARTQSAKT